MSIHWSPLQIGNIATCVQEVDQAVARYVRLRSEVDCLGRMSPQHSPSRVRKDLEALMEGVVKRIAQLEELALDYDLDERSILFDKQKLRLKRIESEYRNEMSESASDPIVLYEVETDMAPDESVGIGMETTNDIDSIDKERKSIEEERVSSRRAQSRNGYASSGRKQPRLSYSVSKRGSSPPAYRPVKPIYSWEVPDSEDTYSEMFGDPDSGIAEEASITILKVKLTPEEEAYLHEDMRKYNRREGKFLKRGSGHLSYSTLSEQKNMDTARLFLTSRGPYIDPDIMKKFKRGSPDSWLAGDFSTSGRRRADAAQSQKSLEFINNGIPYKGSPVTEYVRSLRGTEKEVKGRFVTALPRSRAGQMNSLTSFGY